MKTGTEIAQFVHNRIGHIFHRPLMYGRTAEGVDFLLHYYFELQAFLLDSEEDYLKTSMAVHEEEGTGSADFATHYRRDRPHATNAETARYVVEQWQKIGTRLGFQYDPRDILEGFD